MSELIRIVKHPNGREIIYDDVPHTYTSGDIKFTSVTTVLGEYFPKFDADKVAFFVARKQGKTKEEVLAEWDKTRDDACEYGTAVHWYIESKINGDPLPLANNQKTSRALHIIDQKWDEIVALGKPIEAEKIVASFKHGISGTIDLLAQNSRGQPILVDWKTNKKIEKKARYSKKAHEPINHLNDANFTKYSLQLNLYKYIMETEGYIEDSIAGMYLVHIKPRSIKVYEIPNMQAEIKAILTSRGTL
jgi:ATP-dependent exoDNAse (exonuclease V) beta subunit